MFERKTLYIAEWSSSVARRAHNPKVVGSNPAPATIIKALIQSNQGFFRTFQNFEKKTSGKRRACLRVGNAAQERQNHAVNAVRSL